jgi:hypothetical protein
MPVFDSSTDEMILTRRRIWGMAHDDAKRRVLDVNTQPPQWKLGGCGFASKTRSVRQRGGGIEEAEGSGPSRDEGDGLFSRRAEVGFVVLSVARCDAPHPGTPV